MYFVIGIVLILIVVLLSKKENFDLGVGKSFGFFHRPEQCTPENNCFKGSYLRSQAYQNVCSPDYGGLSRTKVQLQDGCLRTLGNYPKPNVSVKCFLDRRLNRYCFWNRN